MQFSQSSDAPIVLQNSFVTIGGLKSNTMLASLQTVAPRPRPGFRLTVNSISPSPSGDVTFGGRKPSSGSSGNSWVAGSSVVNFQVTMPVAVSRAASTPTRMFTPGRMSTSVEKLLRPAGTGTNLSANEMGPRLNVSRSYFATSSWSVTVTSKASPDAVATFSKVTV